MNTPGDTRQVRQLAVLVPESGGCISPFYVHAPSDASPTMTHWVIIAGCAPERESGKGRHAAVRGAARIRAPQPESAHCGALLQSRAPLKW
eukprot:scaffold243950_cov35-Tisochrysis_lutea.AAC.2